MERAQSPSKLPTPLCEYKTAVVMTLLCHLSNKHSSKKNEAESSKIVIIPTIIRGTDNLEEKMVAMKANARILYYLSRTLVGVELN